jgi:hypothetical protein
MTLQAFLGGWLPRTYPLSCVSGAWLEPCSAVVGRTVLEVGVRE